MSEEQNREVVFSVRNGGFTTSEEGLKARLAGKYNTSYGMRRWELGVFSKPAKKKTEQYNIKYDCLHLLFMINMP